MYQQVDCVVISIRLFSESVNTWFVQLSLWHNIQKALIADCVVGQFLCYGYISILPLAFEYWVFCYYCLKFPCSWFKIICRFLYICNVRYDVITTEQQIYVIHTHTHTHTHSHSHSHSLTLTHTHTHSLTHSLTLMHKIFFVSTYWYVDL